MNETAPGLGVGAGAGSATKMLKKFVGACPGSKPISSVTSELFSAPDKKSESRNKAMSERQSHRLRHTGLTNPKGAAFWTSAFATLLPHAAPTWFLATVVVLVALLSLGWHLGITLVFGLPALRNRYLRLERGINGIAGGALVLLGLQRLSSR